MKNELKDWLIDIIEEKMDIYVGYKVSISELVYKLFEVENVDGSFSYNTKEAEEWIKEYFDDIGEVTEEMLENGLNIPDCFLEPEKFQVAIMIELADFMIQSSDFIHEHWLEEINLTEEIKNKIIEEIKKNYDTYNVFD